MKGLLLFFLLIFPLDANANEYNCPGQDTIEMEYCSSLDLIESNQWLKYQLDPEPFSSWHEAVQKVCSAIYAPYKDGTIYSRMLIECNDRLNRALLDEGVE